MKTEIVHGNVLQAILRLEVLKGHLQWKVSDLARSAKVSRPLIYYHFGRTKKQILEKSVSLIGEEYYGLGADRLNSLKEGHGIESLRRTRSMYLANPALAVFYQRWRMQPSPIGDQLIAIEKQYQAKIRASYPKLSSDQVLAFHALLHGVITAPFLTDRAFEEACRGIFAWLDSIR